MIPRVGLGYDIHPFGTEGTLVLGGVRFEGEPALEGHSDGDVVAHAVADALIGAMGQGDLGMWFRSSDERWANADSLWLLEHVMVDMVQDRWTVGNVDVVVTAERPRLQAHLPEMGQNLRRVIVDAYPAGSSPAPPVNVKAKFGEGIGEIGRGEAIAAWAIALIYRAEGQ